MAHDLNMYDNAFENGDNSKLGDIYLTVVEEETYTYANDITDKPVEDGKVYTDNVQSKPIEVKLTGIIIGQKEYPQEDLTTLREYVLNGNVLKYVGIQSFSKCVIENFENKHTAEVANGITFDITLKEIRAAHRVEINVNTAELSIPDIEALKSQLSAQQSATKAAAKAKVTGATHASRQAKTPKPKKTSKTKKKKAKESIIDQIKSNYE